MHFYTASTSAVQYYNHGYGNSQVLAFAVPPDRNFQLVSTKTRKYISFTFQPEERGGNPLLLLSRQGHSFSSQRARVFPATVPLYCLPILTILHNLTWASVLSFCHRHNSGLLVNYFAAVILICIISSLP